MRGYGERDRREPVTVNRANRHRGEVEAVIDGERRILCLTLGALAELETAFGAESLGDLAARFSTGRLKSADLIRILACGLRGGGNRVSDADVAEMAVEGGVAGAAGVVGELLTVTFQTGGAAGGATAGAGAETTASP
ncbi:gene transfer agent family protein [Rhizobium sp. AG855]|uniref:gene transfer agent family protein n=1 Tax=Rhizobium sp. AG855 TaxID=2183898 RepID=UPI000E7687CB|nr:gene transfer agent family protein [Rhizobium sp. AG855]RKE85510.1 tail tube GTA-gp10-like protein [Rhizobium sp. AG855]